jgi:GNAT superfamily N-acetyltransferase
MKLVSIAAAEQRMALSHARGLPPFDAHQIADHAADSHLCVLDNNGEVRAHCSLWWKAAPRRDGREAGSIGHYAAADDDAAEMLLSAAVDRLSDQGCTLAIGPMDGNTWRRYRFVTGNGLAHLSESHLYEPPFFLEPVNPPGWPLQFERARFRKLAGYYSALNADLGQPDGRIQQAVSRLQDAGVEIRSAVNTDLRAQLKRIYRVSRVAFAGNFLYTEIPEELFVAQYAGLLPRIRPELVLLAERGGELAGYVFAIPDFAQAARGCPIDTFIIKTVAILPDPALRGLGGVLVSRVQQAGHRLGFRRCIHALMHEDNVSLRISRRYAQTIRQYSLYCREIDG